MEVLSMTIVVAHSKFAATPIWSLEHYRYFIDFFSLSLQKTAQDA
jgi:hypothetical protein